MPKFAISWKGRPMNNLRRKTAHVGTSLLMHLKNLQLPPVEQHTVSEQYLSARLQIAQPVNYYLASNFFGTQYESTGAVEVRLHVLRKLSMDLPLQRELCAEEPHFELTFGQFIEVLRARRTRNGIAPFGKWITAYVRNKDGVITALCANCVHKEWRFSPERPENCFRWPRQQIVSK